MLIYINDNRTRHLNLKKNDKKWNVNDLKTTSQIHTSNIQVVTTFRMNGCISL